MSAQSPLTRFEEMISEEEVCRRFGAFIGARELRKARTERRIGFLAGRRGVAFYHPDTVKAFIRERDGRTPPSLLKEVAVPPDARSSNSEAGYVYFLECAGMIKIGRALSIKRRLADIQGCCPIPVRLVRFVNGGGKVERLYHQTFSLCRFRGEWFRFDAALEAFFDLPSDQAHQQVMSGKFQAILPC